MTEYTPEQYSVETRDSLLASLRHLTSATDELVSMISQLDGDSLLPLKVAVALNPAYRATRAALTKHGVL